MLFSALNKYYRPMARGELEDMDVIEFSNAIKVAMAPRISDSGKKLPGMPQSLIDEIWKKAADKGYVELCKQRRKNIKGAASGL